MYLNVWHLDLFAENKKLQQAIYFWSLYHYSIEVYDRKICRFTMENGVAVAMSPKEEELSFAHTRKAREELFNNLKKRDIKKETSENARKWASRLTFEGWKSEVERYEKETK